MAGVEVGRLEVVLGVDTKPLTTGVDKAQKAVSELGKEITGVGREASGDFDKIENAIRELMRSVDRGTEVMSQGFNEVDGSIKHLGTSLNKTEKELNDLDNVGKKTKTTLGDMASKMTSVGTKMSLGITAPMVAAGTAAIKLANDFEFAMSSIVGLVGISESEVNSMEGSVRDMAVEFGRSGVEAAQGLYFITSAGIKGAAAMDVLEQSLKASAVGLGETMIIADAVSSALNAYGQENLSAAQATDAMVAAVREGKMEADALAAAMPRVLPIASSMGVSFEEVSAAFAAMSRNGTDASEAATQIRGILASLLNPTKQAEEQLSAMGLSSSDLRKTIREDGLLKTLEILTTAFGNNEEAAGIVFGNIRALTGVMSLFGSATDVTNQIFANLTDNTGDLDKAFAAMSSTGTFKANQAMAAMKDSMISLGQTIGPIVLPVLATLANAVAKVAGVFSELPEPLKTILVVFGGLLAAAGPLLIAVGSLAKAWLALKAAMATQAFANMATQAAAAGPIIAGVAIAVTAVAAAYMLFSSGSKEAQARQEALTASMKAAGDEASTLTDRVSALIDEYNSLTGVGDNGNPLGAASGAEAFVLAELGAKGLGQAIADAGLTIAAVTQTVQGGTEWFGKFEHAISQGTDATSRATYQSQDLLDILDQYGETGNAVVDSLMAQYRAGQLNGDQFYSTIQVLDELSDAFDDHREATEADAKAMLTNTETIQGLSNILGAEYLNSLIASSLAEADAAGNASRYQYALDQVRTAADRVLDPMRSVTEEELAVAEAAVTANDGLIQLDAAMTLVKASADDGKVSIAALAEQLGVLEQLTANEVQLALLDAQDASEGLYDKFAGLETGSRGVEVAVREQMSAMMGLIAQVTSMGGSAREVLPTLVKMYHDMLDAADAAGIGRQRVLELIDAIGMLDGLSPEIRMYLTMDVSEVKANIETVMRMFGGVTPGGELEARLKERLDFLLEVLNLLETKPQASSRGGGGGSTKKEDPFDWVDNWLADIAEFVKGIVEKDFADQLIQQSAPEIAKALQRVMDEAVKLGLDKLDTSGTLLLFIQGASDQLQAFANELEGADGLRAKLATANKEVAKLEENLNGLKDALAKFIRVDQGKGQLTTLEQLDEALNKYGQLKSNLESLTSALEAFRGEGTDPLQTELSRLDELKASLNDLEQQYKALGSMDGTLTPLERERAKLDDLSKSLNDLKQSRIDYQKSTTESMAKITFAERGGVLGQAKRYLAKATAFRDILMGLRDRDFPPAIIKDVVDAGIDGGTALGRKLLSLSDADLKELKSVQEQIAGVAATTGEVAADVLFTADISEAETAFRNQLSLVRQMYEKAMADSRAEYDAQRKIVEGVYEQQITNAKNLLDQQAQVVEGLYKTAIGEAKKQLKDAEEVADRLGDKIVSLEDAMRDLIKEIADAVKQAGSGSPSPSSGGGGGGGDWTGTPTPDGGAVFTSPGNPPVYLPPGLDFGGFKAAGGVVSPNNSYIVGEAGPELFVPGRSGTVIPNSQMGGGSATVNNYTINVQGGGADVGRQVVKAIQEYERRNGTGWRS